MWFHLISPLWKRTSSSRETGDGQREEERLQEVCSVYTSPSNSATKLVITSMFMRPTSVHEFTVVCLLSKITFGVPIEGTFDVKVIMCVFVF